MLVPFASQQKKKSARNLLVAIYYVIKLKIFRFSKCNLAKTCIRNIENKCMQRAATGKCAGNLILFVGHNEQIEQR